MKLYKQPQQHYHSKFQESLNNLAQFDGSYYQGLVKFSSNLFSVPAHSFSSTYWKKYQLIFTLTFSLQKKLTQDKHMKKMIKKI